LATLKDPDEIDWMRSVLERGDVVIDAGAYKGGYTYTMRREVGSSGAVYAFEPQPELAAFLRRAVKAYGWRNVHVEETGLSDAAGQATLHAPVSGPAATATLFAANAHSDGRHYRVRLETLDSFVGSGSVRRPIAFIKCDVEGNELNAFKGAEAVLRQDRPRLLFECEARHEPSGSVSRVFDYLTGLGYRGFFFHAGRRLDIATFHQGTHQVLGTDPYVNLFAFEPT